MGPAVSGAAGPAVLPGGHRFVLFAAFPAEGFCPLHQGFRSVLRALRNTLAVISDAFEINLQFYEPGHLSEKESLFSGQEHNGSILAGAAESDLAYPAGHKPPLPVVLMNRTLRGNVIFCNREGIARGLLCAMSESGIVVGQDLLLFTTNVAPDSFCRYCTPSLTAIDLKMQTVAEQALKMCIALASHQALSASEVILQPEAIFRDSFPAKTL